MSEILLQIDGKEVRARVGMTVLEAAQSAGMLGWCSNQQAGASWLLLIDQGKCTKCGICFEVCPPRFGAVQKISGEPVPPPIPEEERMIIRKSKEQ